MTSSYEASSYEAFKRSLKEMLLDFLETEDSYTDVDTIIVKMKK